MSWGLYFQNYETYVQSVGFLFIYLFLNKFYASTYMAILPTSPVFPDSTKQHCTFWRGLYVHRQEITAVCGA